MEQTAFPFRTPIARRGRLNDPLWSQAIREQWTARLAKHYPDRPIRVRFNDNRSTMISVRERHGRLELNLHHMFIEAPRGVLAALANYLRGRSRGVDRLDVFIEANRNRITRSRSTGAGALGRRYDLESIRDALGRAYFGGPLAVPIAWGRDRGGRKNSVRLGSYSFEEGEIRIHPILDQSRVPAHVVVGVVYHEMLHHVLGAEQRAGRRVVHGREFRRRERAFVHFERAERWEKDNLAQLVGNE
jgi:hypothetical protein